MPNSSNDLPSIIHYFKNRYFILSPILEQMLKVTQQRADLPQLIQQLNEIKASSFKL